MQLDVYSLQYCPHQISSLSTIFDRRKLPSPLPNHSVSALQNSDCSSPNLSGSVATGDGGTWKNPQEKDNKGDLPNQSSIWLSAVPVNRLI
jgi:hypothetical protein